MRHRWLVVLLAFIIFAAQTFWDASLLSRRVMMTTTTRASGTRPKSSLSPRFALVDYCTGDSFNLLKKLVYYNRLAYAKTHGYGILSGSIEDFPLEPFISPKAWLKPAYLYHLMTNNEGNIDYFVWIDCDVLIARMDWSLKEVLSEKLGISDTHQHDVIVSQDPNTLFNTGVMLLRNTDWSRDLLKRTLQQASINNSTRYNSWWEQRALLDLYESNTHNEQQRIMITPHRTVLNAFRNERRNEYDPDTTFMWHRVNCRKHQQICTQMSVDFFCDTMPKGSYPEYLCRQKTQNMTITKK
jgi:hypothetical protein